MRFKAYFLATAAAAGLVVGTLAGETQAHAEPTTWLALGGGYGFEHNGGPYAQYDARASQFSLSLGLGTTSSRAIVIGGVFRSLTHLTLGTDVSLSARVATGSFARGDLGLALDLGVAGRFWKGQDYGHFPLQAILYGGLPWGFQVGVGAEFWDVSGDRPAGRGGFALLEFDFLRFTVMRSGNTTKYWPNPSPAEGPRAPDAPALP